MSAPLLTAGYTVPWVAKPGQPVQLHASLTHAAVVDVVQLACLNAERGEEGQGFGPAQRIEPVAELGSWNLPARVQHSQHGAQVRVGGPGWPAWQSLRVVFAVQRTLRGSLGHVMSLQDESGQVLQVSVTGTIAASELEVAWTGGAHARVPLPALDWTVVLLEFAPAQDGSTSLVVYSALCRPTVPGGVPDAWTVHAGAATSGVQGAPQRWTLGAPGDERPAADVRLDLLTLVERDAARPTPGELLAAPSPMHVEENAWENKARLAGGLRCALRATPFGSLGVRDLAERAQVALGQRPYHAVRGCRWSGAVQNPAQAPTHYSALHFNGDSLLDCGWNAVLSVRLPDSLPSGAYAFRIRDACRPDWEPTYASFFLTAVGRSKNKLAVLLPTMTYLAYANAPEDMRGPVLTVGERVAEARSDAAHPWHGRSIYDRHRDGSGVLWASARRPLWSVGPGNRPWGLVADSWLLEWLTQQDLAFDVITDHDLHELGANGLTPYAAVVTGHHPEYHSTAMWDGLWSYLHGGGRLLYLGGNGFYWRTAISLVDDLIEVRRAEDGTRPTIAPPGEFHCALNGEYGGLWRRLGRAPQQLVGVGMAAQGFGHAGHYRRLEDSHHPATQFVFDGVNGEAFGASGWWSGGAAGWEVDRLDFDLGTPLGTWWLARSQGHAADLLRTKEELLSYVPPFKDPKARADVVLAPVGQGDVFAVGSMTWIGALHGSTSCELTDVGRITANVIRRFLDPTPIERKEAFRSCAG